ncbi:MAG: glycosyltransferase family 2 protein [Oscillospiraceae bacterium]|nr:glycosyltransferase family 2 protein [Oscillospiraceae bacterium]
MITASVVLYKTPREEVDTVIKSFAPRSERKLFLLDNSPEYNEAFDQIRELPDVEYIFSGENLGYGRANNKGIEKALAAGSDYHIVMNPDLKFEPDIINRLSEFADTDPDIVYILPKVVDEAGRVQHLCKLLPTPADLIFRRFFPDKGVFRKNNERYVLASFSYDRVIDPPCLSGCFMFMRTKTLKEHGLRFDERFFMYCEDFDLIRRLHRVGKTLYYPEVTVIHKQSRASYFDREMLRAHIVSACRYFNKYGWFIDRERREMNRKILRELDACHE